MESISTLGQTTRKYEKHLLRTESMSIFRVRLRCECRAPNRHARLKCTVQPEPGAMIDVGKVGASTLRSRQIGRMY
ncbi:hypothetical protein KC358_g22 [Hortaea werneckii]|nr:hypothetical protein KC358_g22 [Hortaea werneckii]